MEGGKYRFEPRRWGVVEADGFYRSGQIDAHIVEDVLREHGIELIVDLASDDPTADPDEAAEQAAAEKLGIRRIALQLRGDGRGQADRYAAALAEVIRARRAGRRVLVHCNAGRERTGTLVGMYRMLVDGWDGPRAYAEYLHYRDGRPGRPILTRYVEEKLPVVADTLVSAHLLDARPPTLPTFAPATSSPGTSQP
jgi:protein tyrosine/serine phosphatase